ncbi:ribbon-helix-helix domain-containing protein [uncultured Thiocystis sp.]|jgi:hypothetical protein|uniref:ribbon-helix-helix domain-containing protein n=1 Tax=uncultured Thiocystis sp. TaxID=1202134 RepID=UPI0025F47D99|nr:ribbon-helix-helix domain-containing protein [uncultured Thiocystis sp.]
MTSHSRSRKSNLSAALGAFDNRAPVAKETADPTPVPTSSATGQPKAPLPPSRQGKKALTGYFDPAVLKQIKMMAAAEETTIQALMTEAINDLFKKHGKPHIA